MKKILTLLVATTALTACNQDSITGKKEITEEQVKLIIDNYIEENPAKILESVNTYMAKMQEKQAQDALAEKFNNPIKVDLDAKTPVKGAETAPITIVEYSDFECPFCQRANPTLETLLEKYDGKVKIAYKHLPLSFHQNAKSAALASIAANEQGKFWEFHDAIFREQQNLGMDTYTKIAKELNLDLAKFEADMKSEASTAKLEKDMAEANKFGIQGTPHFLVNGVPLSGALPVEEFVTVIEKLLDDLNK